MTLPQIIILAIIQGLAELLPVSSSAHVIAGAKLMHLKADSPEFTLLLVMLHTGTMFAVIVYFWNAWKRAFFSTTEKFVRFANRVIIATAITGVIGLALKVGIEKYLKHAHHGSDAEIEELFGHLELLAGALAAVGVLILWSGFASRRREGVPPAKPNGFPVQLTGEPAPLGALPTLEYEPQLSAREDITSADSLAIGAIQGLCLPFRGFSRSGATISVGLLRGMARARLEEYSFALAVVLTPAVVFLEARRLIHHRVGEAATPIGMHDFRLPLIGMLCSFLAGLIALRLLSRVLEKGQWWVFGVYCLLAAGVMFALYLQGY
jgi:undecaprenyl-diphosphatase